MLREVYTVTILLNIFYLHGMAQLPEGCPNDTVAIMFICAVSNIKKSIADYFAAKAITIEKTRKRAKYGLLQFFRDMRNDTDPYIQASRKALDINKNRTKTKDKPNVAQEPKIKSSMKKHREDNAEDLIKAHGYKPESHHVYTKDGYMLTIHRIMSNGDVHFFQKFEKGAVLLHHGLLGSSDDWLLLDTPSTLPYLLLNNGYDVWLLNARGNKYTSISADKNRSTYTNRNFTWHEMGVYDLPAIITYIIKYTENTNLHYIGHSMGATAMLVLLSKMPEYNTKLKSAIFLAPLAFMHHTKGPLKLFSEFPNATQDYIANGVFPKEIMDNFCQGTFKSCSNTLLFISNGGKVTWDKDVMNNVLKHIPAGGSTKILAHYIQSIRSARFRMYDYGPINNVKVYGSTFPPDYKLDAITLHISIFVSSGDWISTVADTLTLVNKLQNVKTLHILRNDNFSHVDFMWSKQIPNMLYKPIVNVLEMARNITQVYKSTERTTTSEELETGKPTTTTEDFDIDTKEEDD